MLDIVLFIGFVLVSARVASSVRRELPVFEEFKQPKSLALFVLLFPIGPVALLVLPHRVGWLPAAILAVACYLPALLTSRQRIAAFEISGTDRTDAALKSAHLAFGASLVGLIYVSIFVVLIFAASGVGAGNS
jgi:hypothetical protein